MRVSRNMFAPDLNLDYLTQSLTAWYLTEQYAMRRLESSADAVHLKLLPSRRQLGLAPSIEVTMRQQDAGLVVTIEVGKWMRPVLTIGPCFWALMVILGFLLESGALLLCGIAFCIVAFFVFCALRRQSMLQRKTFTIIEQLVAAHNISWVRGGGDQARWLRWRRRALRSGHEPRPRCRPRVSWFSRSLLKD